MTDLLRIAARVLFAYATILVLLRVAGKRSVKQGDMTSFVVALIVGDMFDDVFWGEAEAAQFVIGAGTLIFAHVLAGIEVFRQGSRQFRRALGETGERP
jgi:uncharacterized membrane protein YcaP (DUF421 family)